MSTNTNMELVDLADKIIFTTELTPSLALLYLLQRGIRFDWNGYHIGMTQEGDLCKIGIHNDEEQEMVSPFDASLAEIRKMANDIGEPILKEKLETFLNRVKP